jgi:hypothetical protein
MVLAKEKNHSPHKLRMRSHFDTGCHEFLHHRGKKDNDQLFFGMQSEHDEKNS